MRQMALGDYVKNTYINNSAPGISAARLNNNENKTDELDIASTAQAAAIAVVNNIVSTKKRTARFTIGTSTSGWTASDCDYLCDGTADQVEINAAITALPAAGGEIVILDGTYNITAKISVTKSNVTLSGNGNATVLKRMYDSTSIEGIINVESSKNYCKIKDFYIDGNKVTYTSTNNAGIYLFTSNNNIVTGNTCNNNKYGMYLKSISNNIITGNNCNDNNANGIYLITSSNNNTVTNNNCTNNDSGIYVYGSSNNIITGNNCNDNNANGIYINSSSNNNAVTGNTCNNNTCGVRVDWSNNNTITGNSCMRGTGTTGDYTASQFTIYLTGTYSNYTLISSNQCMGKAVVIGGGTSNTSVNNKFA